MRKLRLPGGGAVATGESGGTLATRQRGEIAAAAWGKERRRVLRKSQMKQKPIHLRSQI
jgi:hypothetical protein